MPITLLARSSLWLRIIVEPPWAHHGICRFRRSMNDAGRSAQASVRARAILSRTGRCTSDKDSRSPDTVPGSDKTRQAKHGCHDNGSGGIPGSGASSASVTAEGYRALLLRSYMQKRSNSPLRTPPRNACHSSDVNRRTSPSDSLLLRTPISPPGRLATSTQLPLAKLRELLTQLKPEFSG
jgi:hypothetical protein